MTDYTLYISPEYNPHSLARDWGFFVREKNPKIQAILTPHGNLGALRQVLFEHAKACVATSRNQKNPATIRLGNKPAKVSTDTVSDDPEQLYREVGLDTLSLALLADVPIHRPLHLTHNNLVGHWRWLRQVWRLCSTVPLLTAEPMASEVQFDVIEEVWQGRNNTAIALLRSSFQQLISSTGAPQPNDYQTFLANLTVFCPFIGTELLWRQGMVTASKDKGMIE
ncbi:MULTISPECIES: hypothetical protein [Thalassospira]|uniref:Uncharacterized protein n=2 Tax=Thalassospira TaxID=168934 RepID=A0A367WG72_9PROT|nr:MULTISPECIES: hypothetical protein [Thalassospira]MDG4718582.1 hypothetical protein [Thalassospira sp. FZY0004]RCK39571.1 hypothetical protein TH19_00490 [Thalassospira profundimaris]